MASRNEGRPLRSGVARTATKQAARRLGTYLRRLRAGQGWTQSQVAEKVEVDAVCEWRRDNVPPGRLKS